MVVAQLVEWTPEIHGSNPVIGKLYIIYIPASGATAVHVDRKFIKHWPGGTRRALEGHCLANPTYLSHLTKLKTQYTFKTSFESSQDNNYL